MSTLDYKEKATIDDIVDLLFAMFSQDEEMSLKWLMGYNRHFEAKPVDLVSQNRSQEIYDYLYHNAYVL
jgi:hypothetical protein